MFFQNYRLSKSLLKNSLESVVSETPSTVKMLMGAKTLVKLAWEHFYSIFGSLRREMPWKISFLFKFEILGVFVNTLTADGKYPVWDCENLKFRIQLQLSSNQKTFSHFFVPFMESSLNFKYFRKKDDRDS